MVSQDQQDNGKQPEQEEPEQQSSSEATSDGSDSVKKAAKKVVKVNVGKISPRPSIWPLALALGLAVLLVGLLIHPVIGAIGAILCIGAAIGWIMERR